MAPLAPPDLNRLVETIGQSPPVDLARPYDASTLRGRTILVTGGASGLGAAFARHWAAHGANLIIGDIDDAAGEALVAELRTITTTTTAGEDGPGSSSSPSPSPSSSGGGGGAAASENNNTNNNHHHFFVHVDVTDWSSQAALFREAARVSPTGALDAVVASAGISDRHGAATGRGFENPAGLDAPDPPAPDLTCIRVNLIGVMYTAHLALFWLQQNGGGGGGGSNSGDDGHDGGEEEEKQKQKQKQKKQARRKRDRHLLLVGSYAGLSAIPGVPEYVTSKHGVTGLFRSLRTLSYRQGVRVNLLCPYFVDTPILGNQAMAMLAGMGLGAQAVWECYAHDYDTVDFFIRRYIRVLNTVTAVKGWVGWATDLFHALFVRRDPAKSSRVG